MFLLPEPPMPALTAGGFFVFHYMFSDGRSDYYFFFTDRHETQKQRQIFQRQRAHQFHKTTKGEMIQ